MRLHRVFTDFSKLASFSIWMDLKKMRPTICPRVSLTRFISPVFLSSSQMRPMNVPSRLTIPTDQKPVLKCAAQHFRYRNMTSHGAVGLRGVYLKIVFGSWILKL